MEGVYIIATKNNLSAVLIQYGGGLNLSQLWELLEDSKTIPYMADEWE